MSNMPPLKTLPAFVAVAKHLSFSKAAEELFVTHSAMSQAVKLLEDYLGKALFLRNTKKVRLTEAGKSYYAAISNGLNIIQEATQQQLGASSSNVLTVNVAMTLAMRWLIPRLPDFQNKYPEIDLRLSSLDMNIDFRNDDIDIAIFYGHEDDWPQLHTKKLFDDKLVLIVSPKLIKSKIKFNKMLEQFKAIYVTAELRKYDWKEWCQKIGVKEPKKSNRIYFPNSSQALQAAISGIGLMVTHKPFITHDIEVKQLSILPGTEVQFAKGYYLVCLADKVKQKKLKRFMSWIIEQSNRSFNLAARSVDKHMPI